MRRLPERAERASAAGVIPDARGDHAAGARHAAHLRQSRDWVGHEMNDELGECCVELVIRERELFGGRLTDVDVG